MPKLDLIAFDADDTLWHNEPLYAIALDKLKGILSRRQAVDHLDHVLFQTEMRNLEYFGYGIKSYTLSMIEAAVAATNGDLCGEEVNQIIDLAREMLAAPVHILDHVMEVIPRLARSHRLMLITKGDLFEQERKINRSGLSGYFTSIEVVSEKDQQTYERLLKKHTVAAERFMMVGNSHRSDILPILSLGGLAVYIPYDLTWTHEKTASADLSAENYYELEHIGLLPPLVERLERDAGSGFPNPH